MELIYKNKVKTSYGEKEISVEYGDITTLDHNVDVLTISAFKNEYSPTIGTIYHSLKQVGIDVMSLAEDKFYDLASSLKTESVIKVENEDLTYISEIHKAINKTILKTLFLILISRKAL